MKNLLYLLLLSLCGLTKAQTLDEYMVIAIDNNPVIKSNLLLYQAAVERVKQSGSFPDPEFSVGYFIRPIETRVGAQEARFTAMQMLPWSGTLKAKENVKSELAKAKYKLYEQSINLLRFKIKEVYYKLYELKQSTHITEENLKILNTLKSVVTIKYENAKASMVDLLRIQMEISELENKILLLKDKRMPLNVSFNQFLNRNPDSEVVIPDSIAIIELSLNKSLIMDSILIKNNQLESIHHQQQSSEYSISLANKLGKPSIGLGLNYIIVSESKDLSSAENGNDAIMPMLTMKIPLYREKYKAFVEEASLNLKALKYIEEEHRNMLYTKMETAWLDYKDAGRRIKLYQDQINTAKQAQNILTKAYSSDGKDFEEILRVQRILLRYELEIVNAIKDNNTSVAIIESLM